VLLCRFQTRDGVHMHFVLNQDGELIITDEAEEVFDVDETNE